MPEGTVALRICQEGHANALALNKDSTQIAVAGRSLLKVLSIDSDGFTEVCNMRGGKNQNLSYSSNDVAWSMLDKNLLATAATNGVVSVWDLSKFGRHKQLLVYGEHERTAHSVTFHTTDQNLLLSGSQDGTIKCFDMRVEKSVNTYYSNSESVRDVKFSPVVPNLFASVSENGTVQLWDLKRTDRCQQQFTAHSGPIYTCDWHPTQHWLATGSRDKQIKVWNMEQRSSLEYTIHTIAVVGRVKWRPERTYHIASCAMVVDYSIYVWDVRRPFIPYASFNEHSNVTTGIAWKADPYVLLSTSKDSTIFKHAFKDAQKPSNHANPQGTTFNYRGDFIYSFKTKNQPTNNTSSNSFRAALMSGTRMSGSKINEPVEDQFHIARSSVVNYTSKPMKDVCQGQTLQQKDYFVLKECAQGYILGGKPLAEICDHNGKIARNLGKHNVSMLWQFVKIVYSSIPKQNSDPFRNTTVNQNLLLANRIKMAAPNSVQHWGDEILDEKIPHTNESQSDEVVQKHFFIPKLGGDLNKLPMNPNNGDDGTIDALNNIVYGDNELTIENMDCIKSLRNGFLYIGPHDLTKNFPWPSDSIMNHDMQQSTRQPDMSRNRRDTSPPPETPTVLKVLMNSTNHQQWNSGKVLADCLNLLVDIDDLQSAVYILIALGEKRNDIPIDESVHEYWLLSYIDLLQRHQFWREATEIVKSSWLRRVCEVNQQSTAVHVNCGDCGRLVSNSVSCYCSKCKSSQSSKCSVCNRIVKGLYAWCQGCSHGGHLMHMKEWFSNHSKCPRCGHLCEYE
ncbi:GATOR complex protein WDR24 isoform X2 [Contarinia nasturtii]|uniref:GATOR complex protein WDR24 isoform X2 n=1 Tax=Contarinia nasturtii TaxID=265458 RepID=UPI0012D45071|nr:GATOR complex protein WDR24 isoform X2 [Contarinia nasturtii]